MKQSFPLRNSTTYAPIPLLPQRDPHKGISKWENITKGDVYER